MSTTSDLQNQKLVAEMNKLNEETRKLVAETEYYQKRNQFFITIFVLGVFAAGIAFAKLFI